MTQAWIVLLQTYGLTIVVSFLVAFVIHIMTILIRRFGSAAKTLPASAELVEAVEPPDDPDELAALAIAIATRRNSVERR